MKAFVLVGQALFAANLIVVAAAAQGNAPALPPADRELSRAIFKQLIEINSQDSNGSVTAAAAAMRERLLGAGFPAEDLVLAGPNERKQNLVAKYRGKVS